MKSFRLRLDEFRRTLFSISDRTTEIREAPLFEHLKGTRNKFELFPGMSKFSEWL